MLFISLTGAFKNVPLGNVYTEDPDDWDRPDKQFQFVTEGIDKIFRLVQGYFCTT